MRCAVLVCEQNRALAAPAAPAAPAVPGDWRSTRTVSYWLLPALGNCNSNNLANYVACDVMVAAGVRVVFDWLLYANFVVVSTVRDDDLLPPFVPPTACLLCVTTTYDLDYVVTSVDVTSCLSLFGSSNCFPSSTSKRLLRRTRWPRQRASLLTPCAQR